jgi:hypothetical protein
MQTCIDLNEDCNSKRSTSQDCDDEDTNNDDMDSKVDTDTSKSDSDSDDDDDDDEDMIENEKMDENEFKLKLAELEKLLSENKFQYQVYVDIIKLTRDNGNLDKLREYREKMSDAFPLAETLWLDWLRDEQKLVASKNDRKRVNDLFLKAVEDYLSVEIWLEYIQFSIGGMADPNGIENIRSICEQAISFAGFHVKKGYLLWEAYREFETALLAGYQHSSEQSLEKTKMVTDQLGRIHRLFKAQLNICLDNIQQTVTEFKQFDESKIDPEMKEIYEKSIGKLKKIERFEANLINNNDDHVKKLSDYKSYIEFELKLVKDFETNKSKNKSND